METTPNDLSREKSKTRLINQERSSGFRPNAENSPSGSSNKPELRKTRGKKRKRPDTDFNAAKALLPGCGRFLNELREKIQAENQDLPSHEVTKTPGNNWRRPQEQGCLEEVDMERYMNEQINAHLNFAAMQKAMKKDGKNQTKSKEDDIGSTLESYKMNHPTVYPYLFETARLVRSLRNYLACGQLVTEGAFSNADALNQIFWAIPDEASGAIVVDFLVDVAVPKLLADVLRSLDQKHPNISSSEEQTNSKAQWALGVRISISAAISSFSDLHDQFCDACGEAGLVKECVKLLRSLKIGTHDFSDVWAIREGPEGSLGFEVLGVLHNLSKSINNKKYFDSCGAVETLVSFYSTEFPTHRMTALLCLAYLVDEKNNHLIMATEEPIKDILKLLEKACNSADRRYLGFSAAEIADGLSYVATNDGNKKMIGQLGGISVLAAMLKDETDLRERLAAVEALYMLSFDEDNKVVMKDDNDIMGLLHCLLDSDDEEIQLASAGVVWEIAGKEKHKTKSSDSEEHIMISYQWDCQKTMLLVKKELECKGFRVWMDVDKMKGDTLETMARAVEKSSVILIAMSREYQSSPNCRSEASYAYARRKKIIPLMMEENYRPDGWLGIILGTKLWMNFEKDPHKGIQQLLKEITSATEVSVQSEALSTPPPMQEAKKRVWSWQKEDVAKWLESIGFDIGDNEVRGKLDGRVLCRLDNLRKESPEFFYNSVKTDLDFPTVIEILQFAEELKQLLN
ncbi:uncharacterized protein [Acropora muricata]|uniref:uncharacterized protein n=1 Tax=Acropora muricata TaxID=159855 RepID=UPI0034E565B5